MKITEIWRYPVKTMAGEKLERAGVDGKLALNCFVIEGGEIAVGDEVQLVRGRACAESTATIE